MFSQHRFDLTQFDAEAPNLYLMVDPSQKFNVSIGQIARQIPGLVLRRASSPG